MGSFNSLHTLFNSGVPHYDVKSAAYGAKGDGTTNDLPAIQAAIDAAATAGGGIVYLPAGTYLVNGSVVLKDRIHLVGAGHRATWVKLGATQNVPVIKTYVSPDGLTIPNAQHTSVRNLGVDGNKANQTAAVNLTGANDAHGIVFNSYSAVANNKNPADWDFDMFHYVENVLIWNTKNIGIYGLSKQSSAWINVWVYDAGDVSFRPNFDTTLLDCVSGRSGTYGFHLGAANIQLTNCKAFFSGNRDATGSSGRNGAGYVMIGDGPGTILTNCVAQDNQTFGYQLDSQAKLYTLTGCVADSNSRNSSGLWPAIDMWTASNNTITSFLATNGNSNGQNQKQALRIRSGSTGNIIQLQHRAQGANTISSAITSTSITGVDASVLGNQIEINNQNGVQTIPYAASITPDPYAGGIAHVGALTGNITINAPSNAHTGANLTLLFAQDSTGGRTVTWNAIYKTDWSVKTAASSISTITFTYDGTNWIQIASNQLITGGSTVTMTGDVTGSSNANTVTKIRGINVSATPPGNNQFLAYNSSNSQYEPATPGAVSSIKPATFVVAAPDAVGTWNAHYVCGASNAQTQINAAIAAASATGGRVLLTDGNFNINSPILLRSGTVLEGQGFGTVIKPTGSSFSGSACIQLNDSTVHATTVRNFYMYGWVTPSGSGICHGLWYSNVGTNSFAAMPTTSADPYHVVNDLYIYGMRGSGIQWTGSASDSETGTLTTSNLQHSVIARVFVNNSRDAGFLLHSTDNFLHECTAANASASSPNGRGGSGFLIRGGNNRLTNCKAYYCVTHGFSITGSRMILSACEAQDNGWDGFRITGSNVIALGLNADSNGRLKTSSYNGSGANTYGDGVYLGGTANMVDFIAFDRGQQDPDPPQNGNGNFQRYGIYVAGTDNIIRGAVDINGRMTGTYGGTRTGQNMLAVTTTESGLDEFRVGTGRVYLNALNTAPTDAQIGNSNFSPWIDQTNGHIVFRYRTSGGTLGTAYAPGYPPVIINAGAITDGLYSSAPPNGTIAVDSSNNRLYVRVGGVWRYSALT